MKLTLAVLVAGLVTSSAALAQSSSSSTAPPAVATGSGDSNTTAAPVPGKNSFTEKQAQNRLLTHGYTSISALTQDDKSIWRGTAMKDGKTVNVAVDYQGNIVGQ